MSEIIIKNLKVDYLDKKKNLIPAIKGIDATFKDGEKVVILGPSGCGKTTLLRTLLGLIPYSGELYLDGVDLSNYSVGERNFAYVSQNLTLQPHMTIFDNIAYPLKIKGIDKENIVSQVFEIAKKLHIEECLSRKPKHISIGQAQRALIAKALVKKANLYLFDEPLSNLDETNKNEERILIKSVIENYNCSMIYVTHEINEATSLGDVIYVMDEGKIVFKGNSKELFESNNEIVKGLVNAR